MIHCLSINIPKKERIETELYNWSEAYLLKRGCTNAIMSSRTSASLPLIVQTQLPVVCQQSVLAKWDRDQVHR